MLNIQKGGYSGMIIHVLDKFENVVGVLSNEAPFSCPFFDDKHIENIRLGTHSYDFSVPAHHEMATKLEVEGSVIFPDIDGKLQMFKIKDIQEHSTDSTVTKQVQTEHTAISDLLTVDVVRPFNKKEQSLSEVIEHVLVGTDYVLGDWETPETLDVEIKDYTTILEAIYTIAELFQVEIQFEVVFEKGVIDKKLIHLKRKLGDVTNKLFTYSKDIVDVKRTENSDALVTAIIGIGKGDSDGERITLAGYNPEEMPDDFYKKLEDDFIYSESSLQAYGNNGKHKFGIYYSDSAKDKETLAQEVVKELKARSVPFVTYEMGVVTLERISGYSAEKVRVGDTINAKDTSLTPTLMIEARVLEITRSYTNPEDDEIVLGDYRPIRINAYDDIDKIRQAIIANEEKWSNSGVSIPEVEEVVDGKIVPIERDLSDVREELKEKEYAIIRQAETPTGDFIKGQLWLDDEGVLHRWTGEDWESMFDDIDLSDLDVITSEEFNETIGEIVKDIGDKVDAEYVDGKLVYKADADSVYTKEEVDSELGDKADTEYVYSKKEVDNALDNKVSNTKFTTDMNGVVKDLKSQESRIKQTEEKIETKVSSSDYNQKVVDLEKDIGQKADNADLQAIETRVKDSETAIEQTDKAIALKANSTDVYTKTETNDVVSDFVDLVEIGGRNLYAYTEGVDSFLPINRINEVTADKIVTTIGRTTETSRNNVTIISNSFESIQQPNTQYTVSGYWMNNEKPIDKDFFHDNNFNISKSVIQESMGINEDTGYTVVTFRTTDSLPAYLFSAKVKVETGDVITIRNMKLEKGSKATDWTPAPEDIDKSLEVIESKVNKNTSELSVQADKIESKVESSEYSKKVTEIESDVIKKANSDDVYTKGNVDTKLKDKANSGDVYTKDNVDSKLKDKASVDDFTAIETRIKSAETSIEQTDKDIALKANTSDVYTKTQADTEVNKRINTAKGEIKITTDGITQEVEQVKKDVKGNKTTLTEHTATIKNLGTSIEQRVTKSEMDGAIVDSKQLLDTRDKNEPPSYYWNKYKRQTVEEFKRRATVGVSKGESYGVLITHVPWTGSSGGHIKQTFKTDNYTFERSSNGNTTWSAWREIEDVAGANKKVNDAVNPLKTRITKAETAITQTEKDIKLRVTETKYNADIKGLNTKMSSAESEIKQTAKDVKFTFDEIDKVKGNINNATTTIDGSGVTVKGGNFFLKDDKVDTRYSVVPATNMIADHSFEMVKRGSSVGSAYYMTKQNDYFYTWGSEGSPRMHSALNSDDVAGLFGLQTMFVNSANYVKQAMWAEKSTTYTVSAHFTASSVGTGGIPRIRVRLQRESGSSTTTRQTWNKAFAKVDGMTVSDMVRYSLSFTTPSNVTKDDFIRVDIMSNNGNWVAVDGVQMVKGSYPTFYEPETAVWNVLNGVKGHDAFSEEMYFQEGLRIGKGGQALRMFPSGSDHSFISYHDKNGSRTGYIGTSSQTYKDDLRMTAEKGRAWIQSRNQVILGVSGGNDFFINNGSLGSLDIYNRTYTSTSQMVRVTVNGILGRSTSSRRYKLIEEPITEKLNPYDLLKITPKSWYDKRTAEECAYTLSTGEETEVQRVERIAGLIAEDVHDAGLGMYVTYDKNGTIDGISENLWNLLIPIVKDHNQELSELSETIEELRKTVEQIKGDK